MSKKFMTGVIVALVAAKDWIFDDQEDLTIRDVFGLDREMFNAPKVTHLTENQRASASALIAAVEEAPDINARYNIIQGPKQEGWAAGRAALRAWFTGMKVAANIATKVDAVLDQLGVSPVQVIAIDADKAKETVFPNITECESAKEDIIMAIFGQHALSRVPRGEFKDGVNIIVHHQWERHRKQFRRAKDTFNAKTELARKKVKGKVTGTVQWRNKNNDIHNSN